MNDLDALASLRDGIAVLAPGHVWLAGAGPGDPGLLTLYALCGLAQADVIVHDALVDKRVLALAGTQAKLEFAGKRGGRPSAMQADISRRLVELAKAGHRVLRLKGGDPCMFGRGGEEAMALAAAGVPFRFIPGVTAGLAALAAASIPATLLGHCRGDDQRRAHPGFDPGARCAGGTRASLRVACDRGRRRDRGRAQSPARPSSAERGGT
jgi:uroporphyrin-III C-methyltransferase